MVNEDAALLNRRVTHMTPPPHFSAAVYRNRIIAARISLDRVRGIFLGPSCKPWPVVADGSPPELSVWVSVTGAA